MPSFFCILKTTGYVSGLFFYNILIFNINYIVFHKNADFQRAEA